MPGPTLAGKVTLDDSQAEAALRRLGTNAAATLGKIDAGIAKAGAAAAAKLQGSMGGALKNFASPIAAIGPAIAAAFAGKAIVSGVANVFAAGRALEVLSRQTGAGVAGLVILQSKFKQAGIDSDKVSSAIFRLQKSIAGVEDDENKGGAGRLTQLGLNLANLRKLAPDQQLMAVGRAISNIQNPAERTAAAMQIFGKSGAELGAVFNGRGFGEISPALTAKAAMMERNAAIFEQIALKLERVANISKTFYVGVADGAAPGLDKLLDRLDKTNLVGIGQKFGQALTDGANDVSGMIDLLKKSGFLGDPKGKSSSGAPDTKAASGVMTDTSTKIANVFSGIPHILGLDTLSASKGGFFTGTNAVTHGLLLAAGYKSGQGSPDAPLPPPPPSRKSYDPYFSSLNRRPGTLPLAPLRNVDVLGIGPKLEALTGGLHGSTSMSLMRPRASSAPSTPLFNLPAVGIAAAQALKAQAANDGKTTDPVTVTGKDMHSQIRMAAAQSGYQVRRMTDEQIDKLGPSLAFDTHQAIGNGRFNATDPYTARVDAARRLGQIAAHTIGIGGALDGDPSTRPGWTGARDAFAGFRAGDPKDLEGVAAAARERRNYFGTGGTSGSLTSGGLGGGAYGRTGNIWNQISGRVSSSKDGSTEHLKKLVSNSDQMLKIWNGDGGGKSGGGGATVT